MINPLVCVLLYGDYHLLHSRLLTKLKQTLPASVKVKLWCNQVCQDTLNLIENSKRFDAHISSENVPKYQAMRSMVESVKTTDLHDWLVWFDDDTEIVRDDWYVQTAEYIKARRSERIGYIGQAWLVHNLPGQKKFIQESAWYRGKPSVLHHGKPGIEFAQGSYWWLSAELVRKLDWPDVRLRHNGGDTLLGEAVRQQGVPFHKYHYGVKPNNAPRRGLSEAPAGCSNPEFRR